MDALLSLLKDLHKKDDIFCETVLNLLGSFDFDVQQRVFASLNKTFNYGADCNVHSAAFCKTLFFIPTGSINEGCALSRWFTDNGGKLEVELDVMVPIGTISSDPTQLIPCAHQGGFYKFRKSINFMSVIPPVFQRWRGLEFMGELLLRMYYDGRGYFSVLMIKSLIEKKANASRDILGIMSDIFTVSTAADYIMVKTFERHGPAMQLILSNQDLRMVLNTFSLDAVMCLRLKEWPKEADEWTWRERASLWPSDDLVVEIVSEGCLLVPKNPDLDHGTGENKCDAEIDAHWRLSFSKAEKRLMQSLSAGDTFCYFFFKSLFTFKMTAVAEQMIEDSTQADQQDGGISSYLAKTTFFWMRERVKFNSEKPEFLVKVLFVQLRTYLEDGRLPHYFTPKVNLLRNMTHKSRKYAIEVVSETITELETNDTKLIKALSTRAVELLNFVDKLTGRINYAGWKLFCKNSIGRTPFSFNFKPAGEEFAKILHALSSDKRVIGFLMLFRYYVFVAGLDQ